MKCSKCRSKSVRNGKSSTGIQRFKCLECGNRFQAEYLNRAYLPNVNDQIIVLIKEGNGIRGIARILQISPTTVIKRIVSISKQIQKPPILFGREYEMDEMMTFIGNRENGRIWIAYAIERETRQVVGFGVGRRNKSTLKQVTNTLILSEANQIRSMPTVHQFNSQWNSSRKKKRYQ